VVLRPWRSGDDALAIASAGRLSATSLDNRFLAGTGGRLPGAYVRHIAAGPRAVWDAQVAEADGMLLGWAEWGRLSADADVADLGVLVADPWQRQGIATTLIRDLLPRAYASGVRTMTADVLPSNAAAHRMLARAFGPARTWAYVDGVVHYEVDLATLLSPVAA
jgi:ribosomal protein S18 acetylase RimI-like enzyme